MTGSYMNYISHPSLGTRPQKNGIFWGSGSKTNHTQAEPNLAHVTEHICNTTLYKSFLNNSTSWEQTSPILMLQQDINNLVA